MVENIAGGMLAGEQAERPATIGASGIVRDTEMAASVTGGHVNRPILGC
jgi:hypothetical protein